MRATGDLDTWIEPTAENIRRLTLALEEFGGVGLSFFEVTEAELIAAKAGFYMGREPDRIDVHTAIAGLSFADAWRGRISAHSFGVETNVLGLAELIAAKRAAIPLREPNSSKALQDAADLAWLEAELKRQRQHPGSS